MVLMADHELATSTMAVRMAASTRADIYDAVLAGLGTIAGPLHGGASQLAYSLLVDAERDGVERALDDTLRWQGVLPGFGHTVYKHGDARFDRAPPAVRATGRARTGRAGPLARRAGRRPLHPAAQCRPGHGRHRLVDGNGTGCRTDPVHRGPGGRVGGPLPRGAGRAAAPLPGPRPSTPHPVAAEPGSRPTLRRWSFPPPTPTAPAW